MGYTNLILKKNVANLGSLGDQVRVKSGYARNYLLPYGFAVEANRKNLKLIEHEKKILEKQIRTMEQAAQILKARLEKMTLEFTRKASSSGKLFGSVTNREIEKVLLEKGIEVDRRNVKPSNIKELGDNVVEVKLFRTIKASLNIKINAEILEEEVEEKEENVEEVEQNQEEVAENQEQEEVKEEDE